MSAWYCQTSLSLSEVAVCINVMQENGHSATSVVAIMVAQSMHKGGA